MFKNSLLRRTSRLIPIVLSTVIISTSCNEDLNTKLIGNWACYTKETGYTEFYIRDSTIQIYSHWMANAGKWKYYYENDTIYYEYGYKGQVTFINDSIFILEGNQSVDTLYKLQDSLLIYNNKTMSRRMSDAEEHYLPFMEQFYKRIEIFEVNHKIDHGSVIDTTEIDTEVILLN